MESNKNNKDGAYAQPPTHVAANHEATRAASYKWLALFTVSIGTFMGTLDASIVNIAFPALTQVFNTTASAVLWISLVYLLINTGLMLTFGRIGDAIGRKQIYTLGFIIFSIGLGLCAIAQSITQLILFRAVQAIGSAMTISNGNAIVTSAFPDRERGKALGIIGGVVSAGFASGPVLGGFLLGTLGWRSVFYLRLPVGIIGAVMARVVLREQKSERQEFKLDLVGSTTFFIGLSCLLLGVNQVSNMGWASPSIMALFAAAAILLAIFILTERKISQPIVDLTLFRKRLFAASSGSLILIFLATSAYSFLMPFYLISGIGYSPLAAGLLLTTVPALTITLGPISGWLSDKLGSRLLCSAGSALVALALFLLAGLTRVSSATDVIIRLLVIGLGSGLFQAPNSSAIMGSVPRDRLGTASAMIATLRQVGMSAGIAIAGAIFTAGQLSRFTMLQQQGVPTYLAQSEALVGGFHDAALVSTIICSLSIVASLVRGGITKSSDSAIMR